MRIQFYGTGASEAFPAMFCDCQWCNEARRLGGKNIRTRSSCQIDDHLLIDFSADSYDHVIRGGLDMRQIQQILFTHSHCDHLYAQDLLTILPPMAWRGQRSVLELYGTQGCTQLLRSMIGNRDVHKDIGMHTLELWTTVAIGDYSVTPMKAVHDPLETCFVYVVQRDGKTLLYGHDSAMFDEETWAALGKFHFDGVVLDCTSATESHVFTVHMGYDENLTIKQRMLHSGMADGNTVFIATHFAHTYGPLHDRLTELFARDGFIAAWDGMRLTL